MASPFKMKPKTPMMKALVGKQANLPQHLKEKILAAPETAKKGSPAKSYGSKSKSPMMKKKNPGSSDFVLDTKKETIARGKKGSYTKKPGGKNIVTTETVQKGSRAQRGTTMSDRQGRGRIGEKTYVRMEGTGPKGSKGAMVKSTVSGAKGTRTLADGTKVVKEASVSKIKKKGVSQPKAKGAKVTKRALGVKEKTASQIKAKGVTTSGKPSASTADLKKKKTAGKSPAKSYGSKKKSPMMKKGVKALEAQRGKK